MIFQTLAVFTVTSIITLASTSLGVTQDATNDATSLPRTRTGNEAFAIQSFAHIPDPEKNLAYSPFGVSEAFAMLYAGSRGETAKDLARVLKFQDQPRKILGSFGTLRKAMHALSKKDGFTLKIADSIWSVPTIKKPYIDSIKLNLDADAFPIDDLGKTKAKMGRLFR